MLSPSYIRRHGREGTSYLICECGRVSMMMDDEDDDNDDGVDDTAHSA